MAAHKPWQVPGHPPNGVAEGIGRPLLCIPDLNDSSKGQHHGAHLSSCIPHQWQLCNQSITGGLARADTQLEKRVL